MCIAQAYMMGWRHAMTQQWVLSTIADWVLNEFAPPSKKKPPSRVVGVKVDRPSQKEHCHKPLILVDGIEPDWELLFEGDFDELAFIRECDKDLEQMQKDDWEPTGNWLLDWFGDMSPKMRDGLLKNWGEAIKQHKANDYDEKGKRRSPFRDWSETWRTPVH